MPPASERRHAARSDVRAWLVALAIALALLGAQAWLAEPLARLPGASSAAARIALALLAASVAAGAWVRWARPVAAAPLGCDCRDRLQALADDLPVGVVLVEHARVIHANAAAGRQLGRDPTGLHGLAVLELFADPEGAAPLLRPGTPQDATVALRRPDGSSVPAEVGARDLSLGARHARLLFACDLSERRRIQAQLERQREELQAMARRLLTVQEDERHTLSRELHDDIGQQITAIKLGVLALRGEDDADRRDDTIAELLDTADQTVAKLRNLSLLLRPPQLDALGLEAALRWQAGVLFRSGPELQLDIVPLPRRPAPEVELACFRIAQEALTNALRHAEAARVRLGLEVRDGELCLSVCDDGRGLPAGGEPGGLGVVTMRERAELAGGRLELGPAEGGGTCVRAELPMPAAG